MIEPLNNTLLVRTVQRQTLRTKGGIVLPPTQQVELVFGEVITIGPGCYNDGGHFVETRLKRGDYIVFQRIYSTDITVNIDGKSELMLFVEECNVQAKMSKDEVMNTSGLERLERLQ